jgi:hypothetical protein
MLGCVAATSQVIAVNTAKILYDHCSRWRRQLGHRKPGSCMMSISQSIRRPAAAVIKQDPSKSIVTLSTVVWSEAFSLSEIGPGGQTIMAAHDDHGRT